MKIKSILMIFFLLTGSIYLQSQPPGDIAAAQDETVKPHGEIAPCATIVNFKQKCDDNGDVVITFNVKNNTAFNVSNVWVYLDNFTTVASLGGILPSGGSSPTITYNVPSGQTDPVCFNIRLLNTKGQPCCFARYCYEIEKCPCAKIGKRGIKCTEKKGVYKFCFNVTNPAYSTNIIDVIMFSSAYPDLCINGIPTPAPIPVGPIAPGDPTLTICVELKGCDSTIPNGEVITITPHLLQFSDPSFCCDADPITVTTPSCCDKFESNATSTNATCNMSDGSVTINVSGGTPPYSLTGVGPGISFLGNSVTRNNLAAGTYNYTVTDANGCIATGTITVTENLCPCNISASPTGGDDGYDETIIANGTGFLCFNFDTRSVPDQLIVIVNGTVVINSGVYSTDNWTTPCAPNTIIFGNNQNFTDQVQVNQGDVVQIIVIGDNCNTIHETYWELDIICQATPCATISPSPLPTSAEMLQIYQSEGLSAPSDGGGKERTGQIAPSNSLQVFPNPVREILNIKNSNSEVQFETINVLDASGKVIMTDNMSGNSDIRVDVSSLPRGIYFIDAMDSTGNKVTERFVKVN